MDFRVSLCCIAVLSGVGPRAAEAQGPRYPDPFRQAISSVRIGQVIRVGTVGRSIRIGRLAQVDSMLTLSGRDAGPPIRPADIVSIDVQGSAANAGARTGAITGGILGGLSFAWLSYAICDAAECHVDAGTTARGVVLGAGSGALVGLIVGALVPAWHRILP